jgi:purine-binding chemotaxis protein CheW
MADAGTVSLCSLRVGDQEFGFDIAQVQEVLGERVMHPVPLAPAFVAGVVPYRGDVLMVMGFRSLLGMQPLHKAGSVLVLQDEHEGELFGLAVDSMGDVRSMSAADFEENSQELDSRRAALFAGAYKMADSLVIKLKPELLWPMRMMELFDNTTGGKICAL